MVPSVASGPLAPNVTAHEPPLGADSVDRPARFTGGVFACGPAVRGGASAVLAGPAPLKFQRSLPLKAASSDAQTMTGRAETRKAMVRRRRNENKFMVSRIFLQCQGDALWASQRHRIPFELTP